MKKIKKHITTTKLLKASMLLLIACGMVLFISSKVVNKSAVINDISVKVIGQGEGQFVTEQDVLNEVLIYIQGQEIGNLRELKLSKLEEVLQQEPHIAKVDLYVGMLGKLNVKVHQHVPIFRIIDKSNNNVYLSDEGIVFPCSKNYTSKVPVITGNIDIKNNKQIEELLSLQKEIAVQPWLSKLIQQVIVNNKGHYEVIPTVGDFTIVLGEMNDLENKFNQLKVFYKKALPVKGWNQYKKLDLSFENQIVCSKK